MKALIIEGYLIHTEELEETQEAIEKRLGCASGCSTSMELRDNAVMFTDREAPGRVFSPHNAYASLVAGQQVYGCAIIVGKGFTDVPARYIQMLEWNDGLRI